MCDEDKRWVPTWSGGVRRVDAGSNEDVHKQWIWTESGGYAQGAVGKRSQRWAGI